MCTSSTSALIVEFSVSLRCGYSPSLLVMNTVIESSCIISWIRPPFRLTFAVCCLVQISWTQWRCSEDVKYVSSGWTFVSFHEMMTVFFCCRYTVSVLLLVACFVWLTGIDALTFLIEHYILHWYFIDENCCRRHSCNNKKKGGRKRFEDGCGWFSAGWVGKRRSRTGDKRKQGSEPLGVSKRFLVINITYRRSYAGRRKLVPHTGILF